mmetsp:Transcript_9155/g.23506  ORF Transcript_9155/g.23506 Transcript_9155/m.23506 type:complete len:245 (+) Transcript_9155:73-807(+)
MKGSAGRRSEGRKVSEGPHIWLCERAAVGAATTAGSAPKQLADDVFSTIVLSNEPQDKPNIDADAPRKILAPLVLVEETLPLAIKIDSDELAVGIEHWGPRVAANSIGGVQDVSWDCTSRRTLLESLEQSWWAFIVRRLRHGACKCVGRFVKEPSERGAWGVHHGIRRTVPLNMAGRQTQSRVGVRVQRLGRRPSMALSQLSKEAAAFAQESTRDRLVRGDHTLYCHGRLHESVLPKLIEVRAL